MKRAKKSARIGIRLSDSDRRDLNHLAEAHGMDLSKFIRIVPSLLADKSA